VCVRVCVCVCVCVRECCVCNYAHGASKVCYSALVLASMCSHLKACRKQRPHAAADA
jgi:hypothetical protein